MLWNRSTMRNLTKLKLFFKIGPVKTGAPKIPQLLFEIPAELKPKKRSAVLIKCDAVSLIEEMKDNYIRGDRVLVDVPNVFPEGEVLIKKCKNSFKTIDNYVIQNALVYGIWLSRAFDKFQEEKRLNRVYGSFDDWVNSRCKVKQTRARKFYQEHLVIASISYRCTIHSLGY